MAISIKEQAPLLKSAIEAAESLRQAEATADDAAILARNVAFKEANGPALTIQVGVALWRWKVAVEAANADTNGHVAKGVKGAILKAAVEAGAFGSRRNVYKLLEAGEQATANWGAVSEAEAEDTEETRPVAAIVAAKAAASGSTSETLREDRAKGKAKAAEAKAAKPLTAAAKTKSAKAEALREWRKVLAEEGKIRAAAAKLADRRKALADRKAKAKAANKAAGLKPRDLTAAAK
jgi:hypothetical protein